MNQKEYERLLKLVWNGDFGACEKFDVCPFAVKACRFTYNLGKLLPRKRYLLCYCWTHPKEMKAYMEKTFK